MMHPALLGLTIVMLFQLIILPLALVLWLAFGRSDSIVQWLLKAAAVGSAVACLTLIGDWSFLSTYGRYVLALLAVVAALYAGYRVRGKPWWVQPTGRAWAPLIAHILLLAATIPLLTTVVQSRQLPDSPVELAFPLRNGTFHVAHGGSRPLLNAHLKVQGPALHDWRGQTWALDIIALYPAGNRARGFFPQELSDYAIFGHPVYAPCAGEVADVENDLPDLIPPTADSVNKAGNYVMLRCDGGYVLLAHLRQQSIVVTPGQSLAPGTFLGEVGNSGNTSEPHLHLHVQAGPGMTTILDAEPLPMLLDGRFPLRNALFRTTD